MITPYMLTIAFGFAAQLLIIVGIAMDLKVKKRGFFIAFPVTVLLYLPVVFLAYSPKTLWISVILESSTALALVAICNKGNVWRNFVIAWTGFQGGNLIFTLESIIWSFVTGDRTFIAYNELEGLRTIIEMFVVAADTVVAAFVLRKVFKRVYKGDGQFFRIIFFVLVTFGTMLAYFRLPYVEEKKKTPVEDLMATLNIYAIIALIIALVTNTMIYVYTRIDMAKLKVIKAELGKEHEIHSGQYRELLENENKLRTIKEKIEEYKDSVPQASREKVMRYINELVGNDGETWMLPLSGSVSVDSVFFKHYKMFAEEDIVFEYHIENFECIGMSDIDAAVLFDVLLKTAGYYCGRCDKNRWILVNVRRMGENIVIKTEFSKMQKDSVKKPKWYMTVKHKGSEKNELYIVQRLARIYGWMMDVADMGNEASVSLFMLPGYDI